MFRQIINKIHLYLGLVSGLIVIIVALTGCIYAFEEEIRSLSQKPEVKIEVSNEARISIQQVIEAVKVKDVKAKITQMMIPGKSDKSISVNTKDKKSYQVNPYTAKVTEGNSARKDWLAINLKLHRELLLGKVGKTIILWNAWFFVFILISGFILWLPKKLKHLKQVLKIKRNAGTKKFTFDLHTVAGFYALPFLIVIVATGIHISNHGKDNGPKLQSTMIANIDKNIVPDKALKQILTSEPTKNIRIFFPKDSVDVLKISLIYPSKGLRKESSFTFDQYSGKLLKSITYNEESLWDKLWKSDVEIHTGKIGGIFGKIIAFLISLTTVSLPITGFMIWRNKQRKSPKKVKKEFVNA